nr:hypothetical protein [Chlamydiota bacterium]
MTSVNSVKFSIAEFVAHFSKENSKLPLEKGQLLCVSGIKALKILSRDHMNDLSHMASILNKIGQAFGSTLAIKAKEGAFKARKNENLISSISFDDPFQVSFTEPVALSFCHDKVRTTIEDFIRLMLISEVSEVSFSPGISLEILGLEWMFSNMGHWRTEGMTKLLSEIKKKDYLGYNLEISDGPLSIAPSLDHTFVAVSGKEGMTVIRKECFKFTPDSLAERLSIEGRIHVPSKCLVKIYQVTGLQESQAFFEKYLKSTFISLTIIEFICGRLIQTLGSNFNIKGKGHPPYKFNISDTEITLMSTTPFTIETSNGRVFVDFNELSSKMNSEHETEYSLKNREMVVYGLSKLDVKE